MYEYICYRCGESGHIKAHCPDARKSPPPPPDGGTDPTYQPPPPPVPRPISERSWYDDHHPMAEWVRELMGWGGSDDRSRKRAAGQVQEARDIRSVMELTRVLPRHISGLSGACIPRA